MPPATATWHAGPGRSSSVRRCSAVAWSTAPGASCLNSFTSGTRPATSRTVPPTGSGPPAAGRITGPMKTDLPLLDPSGAAVKAALPLPDPLPRAGELERLGKRLRHPVGQAVADFGMIEDGDQVMVCLSGGKDSYTMLDVLLQLQRKAPVKFELVAVNLDQKQPGFPEHVLPEYLRSIGVPHHIIEQDTYSVVTRVVPEGKTLCSLCSRLRRGALYSYAAEHGFTKIALGHHRDDMVATFFMNLFHHAKISGMPPKL